METFLIMLLSPIIWSLGDNDYQIRNAATNVARMLRPLSIPALNDALRNEDPEIAMRAEMALNTRYTRHIPTLVALRILYWPPEKGKLPWVPEKTRQTYGTNVAVRLEILRIAKEKGIIKEDERFAFDPEFDQFFWGRRDLAGVDDLRFRIFNLPSPSDWFSKGGTLEDLEKLVK